MWQCFFYFYFINYIELQAPQTARTEYRVQKVLYFEIQNRFFYHLSGFFCIVSAMLYHLSYRKAVNKCITGIKTYLVMQPCHFNFLICRFELFCQTVVTGIRTGAPRLLCTSPYSVSYRTNLQSMKTHIYDAGYVRC